MRVVNFSMDASPTPDVLYRLYEMYTAPDGAATGFTPVLEDIGTLQFSLPDTLRPAPFADGAYTYYVTAYKGSEESVPSNTVTTNFTRPEPPVNLVCSGESS
jgi:hypothetical protein